MFKIRDKRIKWEKKYYRSTSIPFRNKIVETEYILLQEFTGVGCTKV